MTILGNFNPNVVEQATVPMMFGLPLTEDKQKFDINRIGLAMGVDPSDIEKIINEKWVQETSPDWTGSADEFVGYSNAPFRYRSNLFGIKNDAMAFLSGLNQLTPNKKLNLNFGKRWTAPNIIDIGYRGDFSGATASEDYLNEQAKQLRKEHLASTQAEFGKQADEPYDYLDQEEASQKGYGWDTPVDMFTEEALRDRMIPLEKQLSVKEMRNAINKAPGGKSSYFLNTYAVPVVTTAMGTLASIANPVAGAIFNAGLAKFRGGDWKDIGINAGTSLIGGYGGQFLQGLTGATGVAKAAQQAAVAGGTAFGGELAKGEDLSQAAKTGAIAGTTAGVASGASDIAQQGLGDYVASTGFNDSGGLKSGLEAVGLAEADPLMADELRNQMLFGEMGDNLGLVPEAGTDTWFPTDTPLREGVSEFRADSGWLNSDGSYINDIPEFTQRGSSINDLPEDVQPDGIDPNDLGQISSAIAINALPAIASGLLQQQAPRYSPQRDLFPSSLIDYYKTSGSMRDILSEAQQRGTRGLQGIFG